MKFDRPKERPKATREEALDYIPLRFASVKVEPLFLLGIRGYYKASFGNPTANDRIFFDDALFIIETAKNGIFESFNFNTDPSPAFRQHVATLKADEVYDVVQHMHKGQYKALQIVKDIVSRDGESGYDIGRHGINFHYDAEFYSKNSLGCQTVPRSQWLDFQSETYRLMNKHKLKIVKYCLLDN